LCGLYSCYGIQSLSVDPRGAQPITYRTLHVEVFITFISTPHIACTTQSRRVPPMSAPPPPFIFYFLFPRQMSSIGGFGGERVIPPPPSPSVASGAGDTPDECAGYNASGRRTGGARKVVPRKATAGIFNHRLSPGVTPAPRGVPGDEGGGGPVPSRQRNGLATSPASLGEKNVCFWPGGRRKRCLLFFLIRFFLSGFMASLTTTADMFQAPTRQDDIK